MKSEPVTIRLDEDHTVSGILEYPEKNAKDTGLVFAHGKANDMHHPLIAAVSKGLADKGYMCLRFNFFYREMEKKSVDPEHRLILAWQQAIEFMKTRMDAKQIIAVGKSLGARMAAQAAADGKITPDRMIFLGYPLHAPGRKDKLRDMPLKTLDMPLLFFEGTRDPFCDLDYFNPVFKALNGSKQVEIIDGGDHSFKLKKGDHRTEEDIYNTIIETSLTWLK